MVSRIEFLIAAAVWLTASPCAGSDFDVILNEVDYNPFTADDRDEFIELFNRGPTPVDLTDWSFTEGIVYSFPEGVVIGARDYLVLSPDAGRASDRGIPNVLGNYLGKLDNGGEVIKLVNASGAVINRIHYLDGGAWPDRPDGLGLTLELADADERNDLPQAWNSSLVLGGTPGRPNSKAPEPPTGRTVISATGLFQTFKGTASPSTPLTAWAGRGFDASAWPELPGPFGVGTLYNATVATTLTDLASYLTYYIRKTFDISAAEIDGIRSGVLSLSLNLGYDDGFVAYLNGVEVGRGNFGTAGTAMPHTAPADLRIDNPGAIIDLGAFVDALVPAGNVLAVQTANFSGSGDFFSSAELTFAVAPVETKTSRTVVINEVRPTETGALAFIELYNRTSDAVTIGGWSIVDSDGNRYRIPDGTVLNSHALLPINESTLRFATRLDARYALVGTDGETWMDALNPRLGPSGVSYGRVPDGDEDGFLLQSPSRGGQNAVTLQKNVVLNEILYHPVFVAPSETCAYQCSDADQWIELRNRGAAEVDLGSWSLSNGVEYTFPGVTRIAAGGYLVVAADRTRFLAAHTALDPAKVLGPWKRSLSRSSDEINLNDEIGNRIDHVEYGDGEPTNDEDPEDGVDDETLAASEWPKGADDGVLGRSLELTHPSLDNRAGAAWTVGPPGGTPLAQNAGFSTSAGPVVWDVENEPAVPTSAEPVLVTCRASALAAITAVEVLWHLDPGGAVSTVALRDDGASGDKLAGDGIYGGLIPAQASGSVVAFQVRVSTSSRSATIPRPPSVDPYDGFQGPWFLYRVDDAAPPSNGVETYRIIMTEADRDYLLSRDIHSNVLLPCTFIAGGKAFQHVGVRMRGRSSRSWTPHPWRVNVPSQKKYRGFEKINLCPNNVEDEILAGDVFRRAGVPVSQEWLANVLFPGAVTGTGRYNFKEALDTNFLDRHFGGSSGGNFYRTYYDMGPGVGDLSYDGPDVNDFYRTGYIKKSNREEADWSDIIELCRTFDSTETPDAVFVERLQEVIDVREWAMYFAVQSLLSNIDGGIQTGSGEDYFLYRVPVNSAREDAGKILIIPWDYAETFNSTTEALFRPIIVAISRFLTNPAFAPLYYETLQDLGDGVFSRSEMRKMDYLVRPFYGQARADELDTYVVGRNNFYEANIPGRLTAGVSSDEEGQDLIAIGAEWRYWKGTAEPSGGNTDWTKRTGFSDASWTPGPSGFGYGESRPEINTTLDDMENGYTTFYIRKTFAVLDPAALFLLRLVIDYDDGFVAYLNGTEVARRNAGDPGSFVPHDFTEGGGHESGTYATIDITSQKGLLVAGNNVLAIQGVQNTIDSSDFILTPRLVVSGAPSVAGCGNLLFATGPAVTLSGRADAGATRGVKVNGVGVSYICNASGPLWSADLILAPGVNAIRVEAVDSWGRVLETLDLEVVFLAAPMTTVGGTLSGNTTWTAGGGPYVLTADLVVPAGTTLSIGPGAAVFGQPGASLVVRGTLAAAGTADDPILFRSCSCSNRMGGIAFDSTGTGTSAPQHRLAFCDLQFLGVPTGFEGTVAVVGSKLLVEDCSFRDLGAEAIRASGARLDVRRSIFERTGGGVRSATSSVTVTESTFSRPAAGATPVWIDSPPAGFRSLIEGSLIEDGSGNGVRLSAASADLVDSIVRGFEGRAVMVAAGGADGPATTAGTLILNSWIGLDVYNSGQVSGGNLTIAGCGQGVSLLERTAGSGGGQAALHSVIVWDNLSCVTADGNSTVAFTYSDLQESLPGAGNISLDPSFEDPDRGDFSLSPYSPAIAAGKDGADMGAIPYEGNRVLFIRGDADQNQGVDLTDAVKILGYLFGAQTPPACIERLDTNDDVSVDLSDAIYLLFYLYAGGDPPPAPFPGLGVDPKPGGLPCL